MPEVYSGLTGMPGKDRVSGDEALLFLANIRERVTIVTLDETEFIKGIDAAGPRGLQAAVYTTLYLHIVPSLRMRKLSIPGTLNIFAEWAIASPSA